MKAQPYFGKFLRSSWGLLRQKQPRWVLKPKGRFWANFSAKDNQEVPTSSTKPTTSFKISSLSPSSAHFKTLLKNMVLKCFKPFFPALPFQPTPTDSTDPARPPACCNALKFLSAAIKARETKGGAKSCRKEAPNKALRPKQSLKWCSVVVEFGGDFSNDVSCVRVFFAIWLFASVRFFGCRNNVFLLVFWGGFVSSNLKCFSPISFCLGSGGWKRW